MKHYTIKLKLDKEFHVDAENVDSALEKAVREAVSELGLEYLVYYPGDGTIRDIRVCSDCGMACSSDPDERCGNREIVFRDKHKTICSNCSIWYEENNGRIRRRKDR